MKNLKKILMALVLVVLLVSSVVTIAIADASYKGNVETAQKMLEAVYAAEAETGSLVDAKTPGLKSLYNYLVTVNPQDAGYAEIRDAYNTMTFKVMYTYFEEYGAADTDDGRAAALTKVYTYKTSTPVIGNVNDVYFAYGFVCETCGEYRDFAEFEFFNGLAAEGLKCPGKCSEESQKLSYTTDAKKVVKYVDFEKEFNSCALESVEQLVSYLFSLEEMGADEQGKYSSYYKLKKARLEVEAFLKDVVEMEYEPATSELYKGSVADASAKLRGTTTSSDFEKLKTSLASAYTYLRANPVNPTSDEYYVFIKNYDELSGALISSLTARVDACTTPEAKFEELKAFRSYLEQTMISERVVNGFNALRAQIISEYGQADDIIKNLAAIEPVEFTLEYSDDFDEFKAALETAETALANEEDVSELLVGLYASYVSVVAYNPAADGYAELIGRYFAICETYVADKFVTPFNETKTVSGKLALLAEFNGFVSASPLSERVVNKYNELRNALSEKLGAYVGMIVDDNLPVYVAPEKNSSTASGEVLESFVEILNDSVNKYNAAADADKDAALEDIKKAEATIRTYILGVNLDREADYYADFVASYKSARDGVSNALMALVDAAEGDAAIAKLEFVRAFLVEVPLTRDAVTGYNEKVDELVSDADKAATLKISVVYDEIDAVIAEINGTDDVTELRALGVRLYAFSKNTFDITDPAYETYLRDSDAAMSKIADAIYSDIIASLDASDTAADSALVDGYLKYASDVYVESVVAKTVEAIKTVKASFEIFNKEITETNENVGYVASDCDAIKSIIKKFDSAANITERAAAFEELYDAIWNTYFNTAVISCDSYADLMSGYERVCSEFESELEAMLNADVSAYNLAKNIEFVYNFLTAIPFSNAAIETYNTAYTEAASANFGELVSNVDTKCPAADPYKSPEGWNPNLSRINIAIELSLDENGLVEDKFEVAYKILIGEIGVNGPQVIDFGVAGFFNTITSFDDVKQKIVKKYNDMLTSAEEMVGKRAVLDELGAFIEKYPFSKNLVNGYNKIRQDLRDTYTQDSMASFNRFQALVNEIYKRMQGCPIDTRYLSNYERNVYNLIENMLSAAEYSILENYLEVAMGIGGPNALIYQNIAVDELNASIGSFEFGSFNDKLLAERNLELAFTKFIEKFDVQLATLSETEKAKKIENAGAFFVVRQFPPQLISLYNSKYGTSYSAVTVEKGDTPAVLLDYASKLGNVASANDANDARLALVELVNYVNSYKFSEANTSGEMTTKLTEVKKALAEATKAQMDALNKLANSEESSYPVIFDYDFDTTGTSYKPSSTYGNYGFATAKVENVPGTTNKAIKFTTDGNPQINNNITSAANGLVLDFDIMPAKDGKLTMDMYFYGDGTKYAPFSIKDNVLENTGKYSNFPAGSSPITFTPGEFTHLTIVIDHMKGTQELLVDYVSIGKIMINVPQARLQGGNALRVCPKNSTVYVDNWKIYQGTSYRTLGQLASASDDEKFMIYTATLFNEEARATERFAAYYSAQSLKKFVTEECADLVAELDSFDITDIKTEAQSVHLKKIQDLVAAATASAKQSDIDAANIYIDANRLYIDQTSAEFRRCTQALLDVADKIVWLENISQYISVIAKFHRATSYASLTKHLESVTYYYNLCELYDADKLAEAAKAAGAISFTEQMQADEAAVALVPDISFANYYTVYVPAVLASHMRYENSVKAVDCVAFIDTLVENKDALAPDAYKAALLAAAEANFDFVDGYLDVVRKIINSGEYDEDYAGFDHVAEVFEILNPMFFDAAQEAHFAHIEEKLEEYKNTSSYIERAGICTYIRNYIADNEIDMSSDEGQSYMYSLKMCEEELVGYKIEYEAILAANTESFIGMVKKMQAYVTYSKLKPLYEETIAKYYYNMNVDSEEAQAAIAIFDEYGSMIQAWEENSEMLVGYAKDLKSTKMATKFKALVRCSAYVDGVEEGISAEADAAIQLYVKTLAEYMEMIEPTINESADAANVVIALRTNRVSANILAMANAIINK